jgi:hypothetical protein
MDDDVGALLREAIINADEQSLRVLLGAGSAAVARLRDFLDGTHKLDLPKGRDREFIDNTMAVSCWLAAQLPDEYLAAFNNRRWMKSSAVLAGLGYTRRREAVPLLVATLDSDAFWGARLDAARALALFPQPDAVAALLRALDDPEYLVQYHAIQSLGQAGDREALDRLTSLATNPPSQAIGDQATRAAKNLADRLDHGGD